MATVIGPIREGQINDVFYVAGGGSFSTIQAAVDYIKKYNFSVGQVFVAHGHGYDEPISSVTGGLPSIYITEVRDGLYQNWVWNGTQYSPGDFHQLSGYFAHGITYPAVAAVASMDFDPTGSSGKGSGRFSVTSTGASYPALELSSKFADGSNEHVFLLADQDSSGTPHVQMPQTLELTNGSGNSNLWTGSNAMGIVGSKGMYIFADEPNDQIILQGLETGSGSNQKIQINPGGGDVDIALAPTAKLTTTNLNVTGTATFAGTPFNPANFVPKNPTANVAIDRSWNVWSNIGSPPAPIATNPGPAPTTWTAQGATGQGTTGTTVQVGGKGGNIALKGGPGGTAPAGSLNGSGGDVTIDGGANGAGAGTGGFYGNVLIQGTSGGTSIGNENPANNTVIIKGALLNIGSATMPQNINHTGSLSVSGNLFVGGVQYNPANFVPTAPTANVTIDRKWNLWFNSSTPPAPVAGNGGNAPLGWITQGAAGQNTTGTTGQVGGAGGAVQLKGGPGGTAPAGSTNGGGGDVFIDGGTPGAGAGTTGGIGRLFLQATQGAATLGSDFGTLVLKGSTLTIGSVTTPTTANMTGNLNVTGTITGGTKAFRVTHPQDETKWLTHTCLEGPEIGVYYRGESVTADGSVEITLPDYFEALTLTDRRTVLLTQIFEDDSEGFYQLMASRVTGGKFRVRSSVPVAKFCWEVKAIRSDVPELEVITTKDVEVTEE